MSFDDFAADTSAGMTTGGMNGSGFGFGDMNGGDSGVGGSGGAMDGFAGALDGGTVNGGFSQPNGGNGLAFGNGGGLSFGGGSGNGMNGKSNEFGGGAPLTFGGGSGGGMMNGGASGTTGGGRDPDEEYAALAAAVGPLIQAISGNVAETSSAVNKLGTNDDVHSLRKRLTTLAQESKAYAREAGTKIKAAEALEGLSPAMEDRRSVELPKLREAFGSVGAQFRAVEATSIQKQKASMAAQTVSLNQATAAAAAIEEEEEALGEKQGLLTGEMQAARLMEEDNEIEFREYLIEETRKGIEETQQSVEEVNEIFRDMAFIVQEQGVGLNTIADNIVGAEKATEGAAEALVQSSRYQRKFRSMTCWMLFFFTLILVGTVLWAMSQKKSK